MLSMTIIEMIFLEKTGRVKVLPTAANNAYTMCNI